MAFSGNFMCTSFKQELLIGAHNFTNGAHTFKLAMYTNSASFVWLSCRGVHLFKGRP